MRLLVLAAVFVVPATTLADTLYVDADAGDDAWNGHCPYWDGIDCGPKRSIQAAIQAASDADEIVVAPGEYTGPLDYLGKLILVRSSGGNSATFLESPSTPIVTFDQGESRDAELSGFTLRNADHDATGGAIYVYASSPTIRECVFTDNTAVRGAAIGVIEDLSHPTRPLVVDCLFQSNVANRGGALFGSDRSNAHILRCAFESNVSNFGGGALYIGERTNTLVQECIFVSNLAVNGGAARVDSQSSSTQTWFVNCRFHGNRASQNGGAVWANRHRYLNCVFSANRADQNGGAIDTFGSTGMFYNCTFWGNTAGLEGGAIRVVSSEQFLYNCILWGNVPRDYGGEKLRRAYNCNLDNTARVRQLVHSMSLDPRFIDPVGPDGIVGTADDDLRLSEDSPCIDRGSVEFLPADEFDLDGDGDLEEVLPVDHLGNRRVHCFCRGDVTNDQEVDLDDLTQVLKDFGGSSARSDLDGNGQVNLADLGIVLGNFGGTIEMGAYEVLPD